MSSLMLANLTIALLLAISGVAKLRSPEETRDAFVSLRLPRWLSASPAPRLLPWAELALAALLVLSSGWLLVVAAVAAVLQFLAYTAVIARALGFEEKVQCNCFGVLGAQGVSVRTLVRNLLLVLLAGLGFAAAATGQSLSRLAALADGWDWILIAALCTAALFLSLDPGGATGAVADAGDWVASARLRDQQGELINLRSLGSRHGGALLVFLRPGCGPCERLAEELAQLLPATKRPVIPVATAELSDEGPWVGIPGMLLDPNGTLGLALTGGGTPAAITIGGDGKPNGEPVVGLKEVRELIAPGVIEDEPPAATPAPAAEPEPEEYLRKQIPNGVLLAADGSPATPRELAAQQAQLLVGVDSLSADDADRALHQLEDWQRRLPIVDVKLVVPFTLEAGTFTEEQEARAVYDHHAMVSQKLGLRGSASAVLLGADGLLAGGPVSGFEEVAAFVDDIAEQLAQG